MKTILTSCARKPYSNVPSEYVMSAFTDNPEDASLLNDGGKGLYTPLRCAVERSSTTSTAAPALVGRFTFVEFSPDVVISQDSFINENHRNDYLIGEQFQDLKAKLASALGYTKMIATVNCINLPEVIAAYKAGWKMMQTFRSKRSQHDIFLFTKDL